MLVLVLFETRVAAGANFEVAHFEAGRIRLEERPPGYVLGVTRLVLLDLDTRPLIVAGPLDEGSLSLKFGIWNLERPQFWSLEFGVVGA